MENIIIQKELDKIAKNEKKDKEKATKAYKNAAEKAERERQKIEAAIQKAEEAAKELEKQKEEKIKEAKGKLEDEFAKKTEKKQKKIIATATGTTINRNKIIKRVGIVVGTLALFGTLITAGALINELLNKEDKKENEEPTNTTSQTSETTNEDIEEKGNWFTNLFNSNESSTSEQTETTTSEETQVQDDTQVVATINQMANDFVNNIQQHNIEIIVPDENGNARPLTVEDIRKTILWANKHYLSPEVSADAFTTEEVLPVLTSVIQQYNNAGLQLQEVDPNHNPNNQPYTLKFSDLFLTGTPENNHVAKFDNLINDMKNEVPGAAEKLAEEIINVFILATPNPEEVNENAIIVSYYQSITQQKIIDLNPIVEIKGHTYHIIDVITTLTNVEGNIGNEIIAAKIIAEAENEISNCEEKTLTLN